MLSGGGSLFRGEIECLLHGRLKVAALITLVPSLFFLVRNLIEPNRFTPAGRFGLALQALAVLTTAVVAALLWRGHRHPLHVLRGLELALFGVTAAWFAWLQYREFAQDLLFQVAGPGQEPFVLGMAAISSSARWFFLIVIYGVFIPNTWRRCASLVGSVAVIPLLLTVAAASAHGHLNANLASALFDMTVLLATGVAVAVFGSYRFQVLQRQAFEAEQLGQYRLKQRLGAGGMGEVYLAEHLLLRRPCAIKLIRPEQAGDPTTLQRFEREVQAMATLTHWNTVEVYDYGHADDGTFYYVMQYLPGQNLEALVARHGPLPPERAIHFLRQVCGALREAHGIGLLHRDIKPSNIIACERGGVYDVAKLLDFGLVQESRLGKEAGRLTVQGAIVGSPPYMSPEQAAGKDDLDGRSDIYSLGAVAYYLLTGQPPFARDTAMQILLAHAYEPVVPPADLRPGIPADLQAVVLRCLAKAPAQRYPDVDPLEKALAACQAAGRWTDDQAAAWWKERAGEADTATHAVPAFPTEVTRPF
jgi:serine/threonine-protein kinase